MKDNLDDQTTIIIIVFTIILVFVLIFTSIPSRNQLEPSIEWRDNTSQSDTLSLNI